MSDMSLSIEWSFIGDIDYHVRFNDRQVFVGNIQRLKELGYRKYLANAHPDLLNYYNLLMPWFVENKLLTECS